MEGVLALLIPFGAFGVAIFAIWTKHKRQILDKQLKLKQLDNGAGPNSQKMAEELAYLKDRVVVLEKIATDDRSANELKKEIEDLRSE